MNKNKDEGFKVVASNRRGRFEYHILETFEAGIVLSGGEIKSIRQGGISLDESYVRPDRNEIFLIGAHIQPYTFNTVERSYDPLRKRKLLLHSKEILKLIEKVQQKGLTIIPLRVYLKRGKAKLEIALAKGKDNPDKRQTIRSREAEREIARGMNRKIKS